MQDSVLKLGVVRAVKFITPLNQFFTPMCHRYFYQQHHHEDAMNDLYGQHERARENVWARQQDAAALEKLRAQSVAEAEMAEKITQLKAKHS